jgi:hypothetical protein
MYIMFAADPSDLAQRVAVNEPSFAATQPVPAVVLTSTLISFLPTPAVGFGISGLYTAPPRAEANEDLQPDHSRSFIPFSISVRAWQQSCRLST